MIDKRAPVVRGRVATDTGSIISGAVVVVTVAAADTKGILRVGEADTALGRIA